MKPHSLRLLLPAIALSIPALAQTPDFTLDASSGSILVTGTNLAPGADSTTLIAGQSASFSLQIFHYNGAISSPCALVDGDTIKLGAQASPYVVLSVALTTPVPLLSLSVKTNQNTWSAFPPSDPRYSGFKVKGYSVSDYTIQVFTGATQKCVTELGNDVTLAYLRINASPLPAHVQGQGDTDDPPIPMVGGSLRLWALNGAKFTCDTRSATLAITRVLRLETPADPYIYLDGISDWRITAYPQQLEITPGWSH